jgi:transcriptional repressor NrdR
MPMCSKGKAVRGIESDLCAISGAEVDSKKTGEFVMEHLRQMDDAAYVRFASVYRHLADPNCMAEEIEALKEAPNAAKKGCATNWRRPST